MPLHFTLRPYQQTFANAIVRHLAKYKKVIACAATGSGKTKTFLYLADRALTAGKTVLILTESTKIFQQITKELKAGHIADGVRDMAILPGHAYIAMAQTLVRRPKMVQSLQAINSNLLVITDEAHIGTPTKLLKQLPEALHIGFTATPDWRVAKHLPDLYNACVVGPQPDELIQTGNLVSYQHWGRIGADLDALKIKNGEYTEQSQEHVFESRRVYDGLVTDLTTMPFTKGVVFCASIKHATSVAKMLQDNYIPCVEYHSKLSETQQAQAMYRFQQTSEVNILVSVGILTKGWDYPQLDLVVLYRATTSLALYNQMIGRGSRPFENKKLFTVLDYGGNALRHGLWDAHIEWDKKWKAQPKKKKEGVAPVKICPACEYINHASAQVCKNCGVAFIKQEQEPDENTQLVEFTAAYTKMKGRLISSLTPPELAIYARLKNKKGYAARIARAKYQKGELSFLPSFAQAMGYKPGWVHFQTTNIPNEPVEYHDIVLK